MYTTLCFDPIDNFFEGGHILFALRLHAEDDIPVHLDKAAVAIIGEALIACLLGEPFDDGIIETKVKDSIHHPRHRGTSP